MAEWLRTLTALAKVLNEHLCLAKDLSLASNTHI